MQQRANEDLTPRELIRCLVALRFMAKSAIINLRKTRNLIAHHQSIQNNLPQSMPEWAESAGWLAWLKEEELNLKFRQVETGQQLVVLCDLLDRKVSRDAVFDVLNTNVTHRDTEDVRKYGQKTSTLISVLDLENSATKNDDIEIRPLKWCKTMAMLHAMNTSPKLDRAIHDGANEFFGGVFGDYRERSVTERLTGVPG